MDRRRALWNAIEYSKKKVTLILFNETKPNAMRHLFSVHCHNDLSLFGAYVVMGKALACACVCCVAKEPNHLFINTFLQL